MANTRQVIRQVQRAPRPDFDDQLWPINCALGVFSGCVAGVVIATSDFETPNLLENGWVRLATLFMVMAGLVIGTAYLQRRRSVRRMQFAVIASLLLHLWMSVGLNHLYLTTFAVDTESQNDWLDQTRQIPLPDYGRDQTNDLAEEELSKPVENETDPLEETEQEPTTRQTESDQPQTASAAGTGEPSEQQSTTPANLNTRRVQTSAPRSSDRLSGIKLSRRTETGKAEPSELVPVDQPTPVAQPSATTIESSVTAKRASATGRVEETATSEESPAAAAQMTARNDARRPTEDPSPQPEASAPASEPSRQTAAAVPESTAEVETPAVAQSAPSQPSTDAAATSSRTAQAATAPAASPSETPRNAATAATQAASPRRAAPDSPVAGQRTVQPQRTERLAQAPASQTETPQVAAASTPVEKPIESATETSPRQAQPDAEPVPVRVADASDAAPAQANVAVNQPRRADAAAEPTPQAPAARTSPTARSAQPVAAAAEAVEGPSIAAAVGRADPSADPQPAAAAPTRRSGSAPAVASNSDAPGESSTTAQVANQPLRQRSAAGSAAAEAPASASQTAQVSRQATGSSSSSAETTAESAAVASSAGGPKLNIEASATAAAGRAASSASPSASPGVASDAPSVASATPADGRTRLGSAPAAGQSSSESTLRAASPTRSATGGQAVAAAPVPNPTAPSPSPGAGGPAEPQPDAQATAAARGGSPAMTVSDAGLAQPLPDTRPGSASAAVAANNRRATGAADPTAAPSPASGGQIARARPDVTAAMPDAGEGQSPELASGGTTGEPGLEPKPAAGSGARTVAAASALGGAASVDAELGATNRQPSMGGRRGKSGANDGDAPDTAPNIASRVSRSAAGSGAAAETTSAETTEVAAGGGAVNPQVDATAATGSRVRSASGAAGSSAEDPSGEGTASAGALAASGRRGGAKKSTDPSTGSESGGELPSRTAGVASLAGGALAEVGAAVAGSAAAPGSPDAAATASSARTQSSGSVAAAGAAGAESLPGMSGAPVAVGRGASRRGDDQLAAASGAKAQAPGRVNGVDASVTAVVPGVGTELASASAGAGDSPVEAAQPGAGRPRSQTDGQLVLGGTDGNGADGPSKAAPGIAGATRRPGSGESAPVVNGPGGGAPVARSTQGSVGGAIATADDVGPMAAVEQVARNDEQGPAGGASSRPSASMPVEIAALEGPGGLSNSPALQLGLPNRRARPQSESVAISSKRFVLKRSAGQPSVDVHAEASPAFRQRMPSEREKASRSRGGTAGTEEAVEQGLDFLARHQSPDGRWSLDGFTQGRKEKGYEAAGVGEMKSDTAATGLALLAFLGAGYTHRDGKYRDVVEGGLAFLLEHQKPDGDLFSGVGGSTYCWLYSHGIASIALCEAYGMTQDPAVREHAQKSLDFIASAQEPGVGGWRYVPQVGSDTSVSGWQMMALKSGELAGLEVQSSCYPLVTKWLDTAQGPSGVPSRYVYQPNAKFPEQREPSRVMTAEALLMRLYLGWQRNNPHLLAGADYLKENLPEVGTKEKPQRDAYYWYYATQVMFQIGGEHWQAWNERLRPLLLESQTKDGPLAGSWDPGGAVRDKWAKKEGGRLYLTTMNLLMLEVYYRNLPLYQTLGEPVAPPK